MAYFEKQKSRNPKAGFGSKKKRPADKVLMKKSAVSQIQAGQHVYANMGSTLPEQLVYVQKVDGKNAKISWNNGYNQVVDTDIETQYLSKEPSELHKLLSNDPYSEDFAYQRVFLLLREGHAKDVNHALQNYILEMDGDPKMLPPKLVDYAKEQGWF